MPRSFVTEGAIHAPVNLNHIKEGEYPCLWHGRLVYLRIENTQYLLQTKKVVNGKFAAKARVSDGKVEIETLQEKRQ